MGDQNEGTYIALIDSNKYNILEKIKISISSDLNHRITGNHKIFNTLN